MTTTATATPIIDARSKNFRDNFVTKLISMRTLAIQKRTETDKDCIYIIHLTQTKLLNEILDTLIENLPWISASGRSNQRVCVFIRGVADKCDIWMDAMFNQNHKREDRKFFRIVMDKLDAIKETCEKSLKEIEIFHAAPAPSTPTAAPAPAPAQARSRAPSIFNRTPEQASGSTPSIFNLTPEKRDQFIIKYCLRT